MPTVLITAPTAEPVTLAEVKQACRIASDDYTETALLTSLALSARLQAEFLTGRAMVTTIYDLYLPEFPSDDSPIELPFPPLQSVASIKYYDESNVQQTLSSSIYAVDIVSDIGNVYPNYNQEWPDTYERHDAVIIRYTCGYPIVGSAITTPEAIRRWILMHTATEYANAEAAAVGGSMVTLPRDYVDGLLDNYIIRKRFA